MGGSLMAAAASPSLPPAFKRLYMSRPAYTS